MLKSLWRHLSKQRQKQLWLLLVLMIISSLSEIISLGAVVPFLGALTAPEQIFDNQLMQPIIKILQISEPKGLILPLTIIFIVAAIIAGLIRLFLLYILTRLSFAIGSDISINIYRRTLYQAYSVHISRNSSQVINGIITKTVSINQIIQSALRFISSIILIISIMGVLFAINIQAALSAFIIFGLLYYLVILLPFFQFYHLVTFLIIGFRL